MRKLSNNFKLKKIGFTGKLEVGRKKKPGSYSDLAAQNTLESLYHGSRKIFKKKYLHDKYTSNLLNFRKTERSTGKIKTVFELSGSKYIGIVVYRG